MAASIAAIRAGLAARAATISGLRTYAYMAPKPEPPALCVLPTRGDYDRTMNSDDTDYQFDLWVYVSPSDLPRAQEAIDEYLAPSGAKSVRAAINADQTLGGVVDGCRVTGWSAYAQLVDVAGMQMLAATVNVQVMA
jgi:hypothetical protein